MITRRFLILATLTVAVTACSGDDDTSATSTDVASSTTSPSSSTSSSTSAPTMSPTSSTAPTSSAPSSTTAPTSSSPTSIASTAPLTTVEGDIDWRAVVEALGQRRQELYAAPDVTRILEVCGDQTPCFEQLDAQIGDLANKGWHVEGASPYVVLDVRVEGFDGDSIETSNVLTLIVTVERPTAGGQILDASGEVVADVQPETPEGVNTENRTILGRSGPGGDEWRIISQERTGEVPG
ncbi:MAG: hypothetical protein AB7N61_14825 [Acidimicrobiia bacterium]